MNIQGGFIYIDCSKLSNNNPITVPGIFKALSSHCKPVIGTNIDLSGHTAAGTEYFGSGIVLMNYGYIQGQTQIRLSGTINYIMPSGSTGLNINYTVSEDDTIKM